MNFKFDLFIDIVWLATICSTISTIFLKKIRELDFFNRQYISFFSSLIVNFTIGFLISRMFTNLPFNMCFLVGIVTWIGAEAIYEKIRKNINEAPNSELTNYEEEMEDEETN